MSKTMMTVDSGGGGTLRLLEPIGDIQTSIRENLTAAWQLDNAERSQAIQEAVDGKLCADATKAAAAFDSAAQHWKPIIESLRGTINEEIHPYRNSGNAGDDLGQRAEQWMANASMYDTILERLASMQAAAAGWTGPAAEQYKTQLGQQPKAVQGQKDAANEMYHQLNALSTGHSCLSTVAYGYMIQLEIELKASNSANVGGGDKFFLRSAAAEKAGRAFLNKLKSLQFGSDFVYLEAQKKGSVVAQATGQVPNSPAVATH